MAKLCVFYLPMLFVFANFIEYGITEQCSKWDPSGSVTYFDCPRVTDDSYMVNCCGDLNNRYCCGEPEIQSLASIIASAIGSVVFFVIVILVICCCCPCCLLAKRRAQRGMVIAVPQQQTVSNVNVILPASQNYIMPSNQNAPYPSHVPCPAQQHGYPAQQHAYPAQQHAYPAQQPAYPAQQHEYPAPPPYAMQPPPPYTMQQSNAYPCEHPTMGHGSGHATAPYHDQPPENPGYTYDKQPLLKNAN